MAGRKQTPVYSSFSIKENQSYKGKRALCRLCFTEVANNGSRKEQHILNCKKCSDDIKMKYLGNQKEKVENTSIVTPLFKKEEADFVDIVKKRMSFCISNIHLAANLLDPRYRGKDLSPTENVQAFQKVYNLSREMLDVDENKNWQIFPVRGASLSNNVSSTAWWIGLCKHCEISKVASRILDLPAISAACERSFSAQANIHSKKRNRLTNEHAEKLLFVSHNLKLTETEQPEFSGNCSQINVEVGSGQTSNQIHHTETTYTIGQSSQPGSSGFSVRTLKSDKTKSKDTSVHSFESESDSFSSSNIAYEDEESDLSVEAMIGNRSEDSDAEAVEQEFNEAL
ncbi:hypothetical protein Anas_05970 [Armadillidium nasatum]|uniref:HAT C-terminal dimerisation domain-containing protein n=1 Tax=Armadillidium nasatum TaxID=96803 RepID=A0A5N5TAJ7_9CRUS|nr:hypothetical protein Anas_05970 [Armadillidium nasatum]